MIFLREMIRTILFSPFVLMFVGIALSIQLLPSGDWFLSGEEKAGIVRADRLANILAGFSRDAVSIEIGAAQTYVHGCDLELNPQTWASVLSSFSLDVDAFEEGRPMRRYWVEGVQRVARLLVLSGSDSGKLAMTCALGIAGYGDDGTIIPGLIRH